jgi:hypothetical protein
MHMNHLLVSIILRICLEVINFLCVIHPEYFLCITNNFTFELLAL